MKSPYQILGLSSDATQDQIKRAFRKLSKEYHPDKTGGDEEKTKRFREVKTAYDYLSSNPVQNNETRQGKSKIRRSTINLDDWAEAFNRSMENWAAIASKNEEYRTSGDWTVGELEEKLMEFFKKYGLEATAAIYSRRQAFQMDGIMYWMSKGFMETAGSWTGEQEGEINYKLTEDGKRHVRGEDKNQLKLKAPRKKYK